MNKIIKRILIVGGVVMIIFIAINFYIIKSTKAQIFSISGDVSEHQTALLLGARVYDDGRLSHIMEDRALTVIELYQNGKVDKILISGDHGTSAYDEVNTIKDYLINKDISPKDIFTDHAGFDTYDSVYRARDIFRVESMIIVTQEFHLPRAVYIANSLGIKNIGVVADKRDYRDKERNRIRESIARVKAFLNVNLNAKPKFLGDKIPIIGNSSDSWD